MSYESQNSTNKNTQQAMNTGMRQNEMQRGQQREQQAQKEQTREARQGVVTRDFKFEAQKERNGQILQQPRSQEYLAALDMIDFLSSNDEEIIERLKDNMGEDFVEELQEMTDEEIFEMITQAFHEEFAELETNLDDELIAVISQCYIDGCDCHAIDSNGSILEHYNKNQKLPDDMERGRQVYKSWGDNCKCVEIYRACCRVISNSGSVEVVKK